MDLCVWSVQNLSAAYEISEPMRRSNVTRLERAYRYAPPPRQNSDRDGPLTRVRSARVRLYFGIVWSQCFAKARASSCYVAKWLQVHQRDVDLGHWGYVDVEELTCFWYVYVI
jgi:hypothetical protein